MCGIWGWSFTEEGIAQGSIGALGSALAMANESRGPDSWGIAYPGEDNKVMIQKTVGLVTRKLNFRMTKHRILLAHTRRGTTGAITEKNAHPWHIGNIVGAHNGMVSNFEALKAKHPEMKDYEVDSQALLHAIAHKIDIKEVNGWGCVEWYDLTEPSVIYLARGGSGELGIAGIGTSKKTCMGVVWSSETADLERALRLAGFPYFLFKVKNERMVRIAEGRLEKFGRFDFNDKSFTTGHGKWTRRGEDNWADENPTQLGCMASSGSFTMPPAYGDIPETAKEWQPGLLWKTDLQCYVKDYPTYVDHYVRKGFASDSPFLEKWRGKWPQGEPSVLVLPDASKEPVSLPQLALDTVIPLGKDDHLPPARVKRMACEGCDEMKDVGYDANQDVLIYFPRLSRYLCLMCRMEWSEQTGESSGHCDCSE